MKDSSKTKAQLIDELHTLRKRVAELEAITGEQSALSDVSSAITGLKQTEEKYQTLFEYANDAILIIDPIRDEILDVNPKACAMLEYTRAELLTISVSDIHSNDMQKFQVFIQSVVDSGHGWTDELTCLTKTKRVLPAEISASVIHMSGKVCMLALVRNISQRKQTIEKLQKSENRFRNVIEGSLQGIFVKQNSRVVFINQVFAHILGYESPDELLDAGTVIPRIAPYDRERLTNYYQARLAGKYAPSQYEYDTIRQDGSLATLQNSVSVIDWEGEPAILGTVIDITERKRIEETLYFVAQRGWAVDGETFFQSLVQYLAKTLNVDYAFVGKLTKDGTTIRTITLHKLGQIVDNIEYTLDGTPCENIISKSLCSYPQNVQQQFPHDHLLVEMEAESYAGVPLWDSKGNPIGIIVIINRAPLTNISLIETVLRIVAVGAAHELDRQQAEQAIQASEAHYRSLFEESPISLWEQDWSQVKQYIDTLKSRGITDFQSYFTRHPEPLKQYIESVKVVDVNQATLTLYKAKTKEELRENLEKVFRKESFDTPLYGLLALIEGWKSYEYEKVNQTLTGEKLHVLIRAVIAPGYEDTWSKVLITIVDITQRKLAEADMRRRNRELTLLNQIIAASSADMEFETVLNITCKELAVAFDAPRATAALFDQNKKKAQIVARYRNPENQPDLGDTIPIEDNSIVKYLFEYKSPMVINDVNQMAQLTPAHQQALSRLGVVSMIIAPLIFDGDVVGTISISDSIPRNFSMEDLSLTWRVAEQVAGSLARVRLAQTQQLLTTAIEQSIESVVITDIRGRILYVNPAFERTTGYTAQEVLGRNPSILNSGKQDRAYYKVLWDSVSTGNVWQGQFINQKKDGTLYTEQATITPVRDANGNITNYVGVKRDVTQELQLEEQYRQAQKMEAIGRLAGGVAHDFNNLLTAIMGYVGLIELELPANHPVQSDIQGIQNTAQRAASLTRQLLTFARRQIIETQPININNVILNLDKMLRRLIGEDIELVTLTAPDLKQVKADPGQIEQVVVNLVVNARDAMPNGGKVTIETANVTLDQEYAQKHADVTPGPYVQLTLSDTGHGMKGDVKEHIFEPFFTTKDKSKGTGLGLTTCFGIIKQSGGHIWVYSEEGQGTTFKIYLPCIEKTSTTLPEYKRPTQLPEGTETILLVEDEPAVRDLALRILREQGYEVLEAANGQEALDIFEEKPDVTIDLLLTDVIMPQMGGKALAEKVAEMRPEIKIIFISGYTDNTIINHGILEAGINFLQKPFSPVLLAQKVRRVLDD